MAPISLSITFITLSRMSNPIMSASSRGPIGWLQPSFMPLSTSSTEPIKEPTMTQASLSMGSRARLTIKPGLSSARIRVLPIFSPTSLMSSSTSWAVSRPKMTSHSFILGTGEKKCIPTTREGRLVAAARAVREMEEVLEAKMVWSGHISSSWRKTACLASRFSKMASTTRSASRAADRRVSIFSRPMQS